MQELKNELLGRTFLQDGLKGNKELKSAKEFGITNIKQLEDGFYSATFEGKPILIDTYLSVTEETKGGNPNYTVVVIGIEKGKKQVKASFEVGDTVYLSKPYRGYRYGELIAYHHPYWTVRLESGLEIECYEDEFNVNADLGMGSDSANSIYLFDKKRVKADKTDEVLEGVETWKALQSKAKGRLSEESAKALAGTYEQLDREGKKAVHKYLQYLTFDVSSQVATLLGEMIEQVPLETYQDFKEVGFYSDAGKGGSSDDLFALKAACGLKQAGKDAKVLFKGGQFKDRAEIEKVVTEVIGEGKRDTDPKKQDLIDYLIEKLGKKSAEAYEAVNETYNSKLSETENMRKAVAYSYKKGKGGANAVASNKQDITTLSVSAGGYDGYSMSNRAREAYEDGEKPKSKWTKQEIIKELPKKDYPEEKIKELARLPVEVLRDNLLKWSSWHHTSSRYNRTNFYEVRWYDENTFIMPTRPEGIEQEKIEPFVEYLVNPEKGEWGGSRTRPKFLGYEALNGLSYKGDTIVLFKNQTDQYGNRVTGKYYRHSGMREMTVEEYKKLYKSDPPANMIQTKI